MASQHSPDPGLIETLRQSLDSTYEIEREIGGGMSRVFVATERALGRRVVIKVLPPELTAGVNRERFRREIQFAARLQHPHIVPLLTAGQVGDILYYTMPMVEGETLRSRMEREHRLPAAAVVSILQDVVDALAYAHGQGLIHRDIKPENILLQRNHALVTDFGVAKAITEALPGTAATTIGIAVGTPAYMAPEQLAADPAADHRIDLYAVGLLGYELLNGASPFSGSSPQATLARQMTERPTPPHIRRTDVPPDLSSLIMRCLEKDPESRWKSADELLEALGKLHLTGKVNAITRIVSMPKARRNMLVGSTLIILLAASLSTYAMLGGHRRTEPARAAAPPETVQTSTQGAQSGLTRADSEAIAAAFARRILEDRAPAIDARLAPKPNSKQGGTPIGGVPNPPTRPDSAVTRIEIGPGLAITPGKYFNKAELDSIKSEVEKTLGDSVLKTLAMVRNLGRRIPGIPPGVTVPPEFGMVRPDSAGGPRRLVILDVIDVSREHNLNEVATSVTDSLVQGLRHRPNTHVLAGKRLEDLEKRFGSDEMLGMSLAASGVLRSSLSVRRDTLMLFIALFDSRTQRYVRSFRVSAPRTTPEELSRKMLPMIQEWLDRPPTNRPPT